MWSAALESIIQELSRFISKEFIQKVNEDLPEIVKALELDILLRESNNTHNLIISSQLNPLVSTVSPFIVGRLSIQLLTTLLRVLWFLAVNTPLPLLLFHR